jgi:hypothetical protein
MKFLKSIIFFISVSCLLFLITDSAYSRSAEKIQKGTVYVPAYSSINHSDVKWEFNLTVTLSIHNIDLKNKIYIESIDYYNSSGKIIQSFVYDKKINLQPMETYNIAIKEKDTRGGIGANFIVKWHSHVKVNKPIIETIMISTSGQQGISFTSRGVTIAE